jgi:DNA-binding CsgD family transcriptional regulator
MEHLRRADLDAVMRLLRNLYELDGLPSFQKRLLAQLPTVVPCDTVIYCENNLVSKESRGFSDIPGAFDERDARVYARHVHESPLLRAYRRGLGSAVKYSDFLTRREFQRTGLYNEFFRKRGIEFRIAKGLPGPPGLVTAVFLDRSGRRDFGERDRLVLNLLRPHLNQSYQNAVIVSALRDEVAMFEQGLEHVDAGLVLLDPEDRPRLATTLARRWLTEFFGAHAAGGSLPDAVARWITSHVSTSRDDLPPPMTPLVVDGEALCLVVRLLAHNSRRFLVLQTQPRQMARMSPGDLGLSHRETEVMTWIAQGKTNLETAIILQLSRRTVEKHLEHIYRKLGVETRTAAAARVLAVPSGDAAGWRSACARDGSTPSPAVSGQQSEENEATSA